MPRAKKAKRHGDVQVLAMKSGAVRARPSSRVGPDSPDVNFNRGTIVGGNESAERQDLIRNRGWGTVTSQFPKNGVVTIKWDGTGKYERWSVDLLEIIDRPEAQ